MRLQEIKITIITIITDEILSWNLNEPLVIENIEYTNFMDYVQSIIHELKIIFLNLKVYSPFEANCFKNNFISEINQQSEYFLDIVNRL
jgi:hypothetical protein